jgi:phosphoribosylformylglycinamidine cyclo-ligase
MNDTGEAKPLSYRDSGVDIDEGNRLVRRIKTMTRENRRRENLGGIGSFGGTYDLSGLGLDRPVLVSSIDGVGTKLAVARMMDRHDTVGRDIVFHCVNDIMVQGASPLFFTDYIGCGKLDADVLSRVIRGIVDACGEADCELLGGETAEMPGMYRPGEYDLVGSITGVVERSRLITGERIEERDVLIALPSSGLHTNGYSLARTICFDRMGFAVDRHIPELGRSLGDALLEPHRSYAKLLKELMKTDRVRGLAHITGGGMTENLPRILPEGLGARIDPGVLEIPPLFLCLERWGGVTRDEMFRVFNMGVGMVVVSSPDDADGCLERCRRIYPGSRAIGEIVRDPGRRVRYE